MGVLLLKTAKRGKELPNVGQEGVWGENAPLPGPHDTKQCLQLGSEVQLPVVLGPFSQIATRGRCEREGGASGRRYREYTQHTLLVCLIHALAAPSANPRPGSLKACVAFQGALPVQDTGVRSRGLDTAKEDGTGIGRRGV